MYTVKLATTETTYMQVAYFGAYFIFSIPASMISKRFGYKKAIIFGLSLYVIGALCFYPSATNLSFGGFVGSLFVIACGIATLENCANTYITIIGSRKHASLRINTAQAFNGLASTIAPVIASYAFFGGDEGDTSSNTLDSVKWTYIGVACGKGNSILNFEIVSNSHALNYTGVFVIGVIFCFAHIPEVDEEAFMAAEAAETGEVVRRASLLSPHLLLGSFTQFMYTGAQVAVASMFMFYASDVGHFPDSRGSILLSAGQGCFTIGRFIGAGLMSRYRADYLMIFFSIGAIISNIFVISMKTESTTYALLALMFFESILFPTIFSLGTRDLGRNHKRGSAFIIAGVSGGAVLPPIQAVIHDNVNVNISFVIPLIAFVVVLAYGIVGHRWVRYVDDPIVNSQNEIETEKAD
ncbi:hypothetical protein HPULCUR_010737 [Helicostylum pulchrum]|uniref:Glucose/galactose transporter n=1 Tax=Helicostylum pulchrum TaxID=562976 RepID=A0ABP9YF23_9FUNG